ncbi:glycosyltransferase family 2 protein [Helicobacter cinaedi]|uniref:glycosyltransferase family 2 protein n=3 Tax=Helicobacter TaxID=209 RepID=UPI000CF124C7|nr:glycosyltransferase family A protein [Helicobacter cinaedi]QOQ96464.1 glycosyltransferase family 2 protein [Helicobacter cinaedi]
MQTARTCKDKCVGIVVPMFNVAPYLKESLDSILNQSYPHFYAILINDGSTDETLQIAKEYVAKDSRFVLVDKENGGLSNARNVGIDYFKGAFVKEYTDSAYSQAIKAFSWWWWGGGV